MNVATIKSKNLLILNNNFQVKTVCCVILSFILLNQYLVWLTPHPLLDYNNWDIHQVSFMSSSHSAWPLQHGVESFHTYGPLYKYLNPSVGVDSDSLHFTWKVIAFIPYLLIFIIFTWRLNVLSVLIISFTFLIFKCPFYHHFPILSWAWTLIYYNSSKRTQLWLELLALCFISILVSYKFSWGIAWILQCGFSICIFRSYSNKGFSVLLSRLFFILVGCGFTYYLATGSILTFFDYLHFSLNDTKSYSEVMQRPQIRNWWAVLIYPLLVGSIMLITLFIKSPIRLLILSSFPIVFILFKYSYTLADYHNSRFFICYFPYLFFFLWIIYAHQFKANIVFAFAVGITFYMSLTIMSKATHPLLFNREFAFNLFSNINDQFKNSKSESIKALDSHLSNFSWLNNKIVDKALLSIPGQNYLSLLGNERLVLPSNQHCFRADENGIQLTFRDIEYIKNKNCAILFENIQIEQQVPMNHSQQFYIYLLKNFSPVQKKNNFILFERNPYEQQLILTKLTEISLHEGKGKAHFITPPRSILFLKSSNLKHWFYPLRKTILKGDRLYMNWNKHSITKKYKPGLTSFHNGLLLCPELENFNNDHKTSQQSIEFKGLESIQYPYDFGYYMKSIRSMCNIEIWMYEPIVKK